MRTRSSLAVPVILLALALASCAESTKPAFSDIVGVYRLQIAPGATATLRPEPRSTSTVTVTEAVLELNPVWRFSMAYTIPSGSGTVGLSVAGSYTHEGSVVGLLYDSGASQTGALDADAITVTTQDGQTLVFEKVG
jgi:hypothetical protein